MAIKTERLIRIYNRLRRGPVTIDMLHKWTKQAGITVSQRQLYRDLRELVSLQLSPNENIIEEEIGEKNQKVWKMVFYQKKKSVSQSELNTYGLFRNLVPRTLKEMRGDTLEKFDTALYKFLSDGKTERSFKAFEFGIQNSNFYEYLHGKNDWEKLDGIIWAINNSRQIILKSFYHNNSDFQSQPFAQAFLNPVYLLQHRGHLHLCAIDSLTTRLLIFGIDKEFEFELTNQTFSKKNVEAIYKTQMQQRFGITESLNKQSYKIVIEIEKRVGEFMQNFYWHNTQQFKVKNKDVVVLTMTCGINRELIGWLFMWLNQVKVKQPSVLVNIMKTQINDLGKMYNTNETPKEFEYFLA